MAPYLRPRSLSPHAVGALPAAVASLAWQTALERRRDGLAVLVGGEVRSVAQQMHDAGLNCGVRKGREDRLQEALQAIDHRRRDVLDPAVAQLRHHARPVLDALVGLDPRPEDLPASVGPHPECEVDRLVAHEALVADLRSQNGGTGRAAGRASSMSAAHMGEDDELIGAPSDALDGAARQG